MDLVTFTEEILNGKLPFFVQFQETHLHEHLNKINFNGIISDL